MINKNNSGAALVEFAIILPVLLLILLGVIEFGLYFLKAHVGQRTVSTTAIAIQHDPNGLNTQRTAYASIGLVNFNEGSNYVCAQAYPDLPSATAGRCTGRVWDTAAPAGHTGSSYYVAVAAMAEHTAITPMLSRFLPDVGAFQIVEINTASAPTGTAGKLRVRNYTLLRPANGHPSAALPSDSSTGVSTSEPLAIARTRRGYMWSQQITEKHDFCSLNASHSTHTDNNDGFTQCEVLGSAESGWTLYLLRGGNSFKNPQAGFPTYCSATCFTLQ